MKPVLVGDGDDALGFRLAGVPVFAAATSEEAEARIAQIAAAIDDPVIIVSHRAAPTLRGSGPLFAVLPEEPPWR